jgi:hypothetical protein
MERETLMEKTIGQIERLSPKSMQEVSDFVEFIAHKSDNAMITEGLQELASIRHSFDFLYNEPEIYSVNDLKVIFS